jgi:hypothetical protein
MRDEGLVPIDTRRFGISGWLRRKQWWYFEGLDPQEKVYFVFLALQAFPTNYVSLKIIDYQNDRRWTEDHLGNFFTAPGDQVEVAAEGKWGFFRLRGCAEQGWKVEVETPHVKADCTQLPRAPVYRNRLLTQHIDYTINQFILNQAQGKIQLDGQEHPFSGYGYHEHNWGVQPRHSTAHWLHFWCPEKAGVVLSCNYDAGVPHHYTLLWDRGIEHTLYSPALFGFDPAHPQADWQVKSPDLALHVRPITGHFTRMRIPPFPAYIDVDYYEQLVEVEGSAWARGEQINIQGLGKLDHNWNRW